MAKIVVSLLTYNSAKHLELCLAHIAAQTFNDFELVCRDNNSTDDSVALVSRLAPGCRVISQKTNDGFSRGHNATIRETQSEYVCILNADVALLPSYFDECIAFLDRNPAAGAVSGLLLKTNTLTEKPADGIIDSSGIELLKTGECRNANAGKPASVCGDTTRVLGVPATAAVYRRSALEDVAMEIGGRKEYFDEDFFMYKEDVDLAVRFALRGWEAYTLPLTRAHHIRSTAPKRFVRPSSFINRLSYRNHCFLLINTIPTDVFKRYWLWIALYECVKFLYNK